jgi:hypothetical protein
MTKDTSSTLDTLFDFQVTTEQSTIRSGFAHNISHQARTFNLYIIISSIRSVGFGLLRTESNNDDAKIRGAKQELSTQQSRSGFTKAPYRTPVPSVRIFHSCEL